MWWELTRHHILKDKYTDLKCGDIVNIEWNWRAGRPILPHRTVSGRWVWLRMAYQRRVWVYTGFIDEPETQWGTLFDVLRTS